MQFKFRSDLVGFILSLGQQQIGLGSDIHRCNWVGLIPDQNISFGKPNYFRSNETDQMRSRCVWTRGLGLCFDTPGCRLLTW